MFDVADRLDGLRCWPTERLVMRREELVREQRRLRVEELAVVAVVAVRDERGRIDDIANLAAVCRAGGHHGLLVPTGRRRCSATRTGPTASDSCTSTT